MESARVTLIGPLSLAVGRYRFLKGKPVIVNDKELLEYVKLNPKFKVEAIKKPDSPAKAPKPTAKKTADPKKPVVKKEVEPKEVTPADAPPKRLSRKVKNDEDGAS